MEEHVVVLNGKKMLRGCELAVTAMSIGEKAKITFSRDLYCIDDGVCRAPAGGNSFVAIITLLGIE